VRYKKSYYGRQNFASPLNFFCISIFHLPNNGLQLLLSKKKPNKNLKNFKKICDKKKLYRHNLVNNLFFNMQKLSRLGVILSFNGQNIPNPIKLRKNLVLLSALRRRE